MPPPARVQILDRGLRLRAPCTVALAWDIFAFGPARVTLSPNIISCSFGRRARLRLERWYISIQIWMLSDIAIRVSRVIALESYDLGHHLGVMRVSPALKAISKAVTLSGPLLIATLFRLRRCRPARLGLAWRARLGLAAWYLLVTNPLLLRGLCLIFSVKLLARARPVAEVRLIASKCLIKLFLAPRLFRTLCAIQFLARCAWRARLGRGFGLDAPTRLAQWARLVLPWPGELAAILVPWSNMGCLAALPRPSAADRVGEPSGSPVVRTVSPALRDPSPRETGDTNGECFMTKTSPARSPFMNISSTWPMRRRPSCTEIMLSAVIVPMF